MAYVSDIDGITHRVSRNGLACTYHGRCPDNFANYSPPTDMLAASKVKNWADGKSVVANRIKDELKANGWRYETRYVGKPGLYGIAIWPNTFAGDIVPRRIAIAHLDNIDNIRAFHIASGCDESELPPLADSNRVSLVDSSPAIGSTGIWL